MSKPKVTIVGPGRLGSALAHALVDAGYRLGEIVFHRTKGRAARHSSEQSARKLARDYRARAVEMDQAKFGANVVWLCVGDSAIEKTATTIAKRGSWQGKIVFHSSGALGSHELSPLRLAGAAVAAVHPMMSFVHGGTEATFEVPFAVEGDQRAARAARQIIRELGGETLHISAANKPLYHAFGAFISPLIISTLALAERVGVKSGIRRNYVRQAITPILATTVFNYITLGPAAAFSGPLIRGDAETVRKNLAALKKVPDGQAVYRALARSALRTLPVANKKKLARVLGRENV